MRRALLAIFVILVITIVTYQWHSVSTFYNGIMKKFKNKKTKMVNASPKFNKDVEDLDLELEVRFVRYLSDYNKKYNEDEYKRRFKNFKASLKEIARLNKLENKTVFGLTKFSDMSKEEFADRVLLKRPNLPKCQSRHRECFNKFEDDNNLLRSTYGVEINSSHDWRKQKGVVKPVLDQKFCQGCWAFSIVGVLESMSAIQLQDYNSRSIEELIDCSFHTNGCYNGSVAIAMDFICDKKLKFVTAEEYPLTLSMEKKCKLPTTYIGRRVKQFKHMCHMNEHYIVGLIATHGPLVVAVDASNWMNYIGGVIERACTRDVANHVVQIVGYEGYWGSTAETPTPYYIVRNSWGLDWGDDGYVKIAMHHDVCGIAEQVTAIDALKDI